MNRSSCASGSGIGPLVLDRVLGRDHHEGPGELVRVAVDGDMQLLHALEQARLGLRRGAVDLVDEDDVREHGPGVEVELRLRLVEDVGPDDVGGKQVHRALHAGVFGVDGAGERAGERRLADARVVLDEHVALGKQGDQEVADDVVRDLHRAADVVPQPGSRLRHRIRIELRQACHRSPWYARLNCTGALRPPRRPYKRRGEGPTYHPLSLSDLLLGLLCAFGASLLFDLGVALQALEARDAAHRRPSAVADRRAHPQPPVARGDARRRLRLAAPPRRARARPAHGGPAGARRRPAPPLFLGDRMLGESVGPREVIAVLAIIVGVAGMALAAPGHASTHGGPAAPRARARGARAVALAPYALRRRGIAGERPGADRRRLRVRLDRHRVEADRRLSLVELRLGVCSGPRSPRVRGGRPAERDERPSAPPGDAGRPDRLRRADRLPVLLAPVLGGESWSGTPLGGLALLGFLAAVAAGAWLLGSTRSVSGLVAARTEGEPVDPEAAQAEPEAGRRDADSPRYRGVIRIRARQALIAPP